MKRETSWKLSFSKPKFNFKNNKTYCAITATMFNYEMGDFTPSKKVFVAETTLSENDTYDKIKGMHIAETKAKLLAYKDARAAFRNYFKMIKKSYDSAKYFNDMLNHLVESETKHFEWLK